MKQSGSFFIKKLVNPAPLLWLFVFDSNIR